MLTRIKRGQVTLEMVLGLILVAVLSIFAIRFWSRLNTDTISYVRWFENQRKAWTSNPDNPVIPGEPDIDYTSLDNAIADLNEAIAGLSAQKDGQESEAALRRAEALGLRRAGARFACFFIYCPKYYFDAQAWMESRGKIIEAVYREDTAASLGMKISGLREKRDKFMQARALLEAGDPEGADAIMESAQETRTQEEMLLNEAARLKAEADSLVKEAGELLIQAGRHWQGRYGFNCWGSYAEAIADEGLYEEAEAKSAGCYGKFLFRRETDKISEGLAQNKRAQAEQLAAMAAQPLPEPAAEKGE